MTIEDELRGALDVAAPPTRTTLDEVLRRGRRRVFAQRAGAALGVVIVVAGVGFSAAALNSAGPAGPATPPSSLTESRPTPTQAFDWRRVDTPPQSAPQTFQPGSSAPPPSGWRNLELPRCDMKMWQVSLAKEVGTVALPPEFLGKVQEGLLRHATGSKVSALKSETNHPSYRADVSDDQGTGSISVTAGRFNGTPRAAADAAVWETGDCDPPYREVLESGTIVQLHEVHAFEPFRSLVQRMVIYRADGLLIQLELGSFGSPDMRPDPKRPGEQERFGKGRETLPMTQQQFAMLGLTVAEGA